MSALDELKSMIREKGGNTNVSSLAEALREYNKYDDASGGSGGGGIFPVDIAEGEDEIGYADKSWNEIKESYDNGLLPVLVIDRAAQVIDDNPRAENIDAHVVAAVCYMETYSIDDEPRYKVDFYNGEYFTLQSTDADVPMVGD